MAKKPTVTTVSSGFASNTQLNSNFTALRDAFDNTLSLDGSTPNAMQADLDLNNNDLLNASVVNTATLKIGGVNVVPSAATALAIKKEFNTVAALLADTGTYSSYAENDYLRVVDGGFTYRVAASGVTNQHVTTAGGVKLYTLSRMLDAIGARLTTNDSAVFAVAALAGGQWGLTPGALYRCANVALNVAGTVIHCDGQATIEKNANGPIFTGSGDDLQFCGVSFSGSGFTGDNLSLTGNRPRFTRCNSQLASGRALKATGQHVYVDGGYWNTSDAGASGFDFELGVEGTATLYHRILGVNTTQSTGGVLLIDCGSASVVGSQFGKLTIQASASPPAGTNGGYVGGNRINGAVTIGLSNTVITSNTISNVACTINTGLTGVIWDNLHAVGSTLVNNATAGANHIVRRESSRTSNQGLSSNGQTYVYGADAQQTALVVREASNTFEFYGAVHAPAMQLPNLGPLRLRSAGGINYDSFFMDASGNVTVGHPSAGGFTTLHGSTSTFFNVGGTSIAQVYSGGIRPQTDNASTLGTASQRWTEVHALRVRTHGVTVAGLTPAATAGAGARSFVTDANATTFASIVAGGGANGVPVYSDGTNWRIG